MSLSIKINERDPTQEGHFGFAQKIHAWMNGLID